MTDRPHQLTADRPDPPSRPLIQRIGAILWPSFFAAAVATVVFFIFVDPLVLRDMTFPEMNISRQGGYTIAFFMFWAATSASSLFTWFLLRPASHFRKPQG
ncbi:MAG: hypothetical protein EA370_14840 [Wenzhouxiangella sp.]|nr:MAG: hypothetical protein EA370_14840 [Wenzhouxiangella sp.]